MRFISMLVPIVGGDLLQDIQILSSQIISEEGCDSGFKQKEEILFPILERIMKQDCFKTDFTNYLSDKKTQFSIDWLAEVGKTIVTQSDPDEMDQAAKEHQRIFFPKNAVAVEQSDNGPDEVNDQNDQKGDERDETQKQTDSLVPNFVIGDEAKEENRLKKIREKQILKHSDDAKTRNLEFTAKQKAITEEITKTKAEIEKLKNHDPKGLLLLYKSELESLENKMNKLNHK